MWNSAVQIIRLALLLRVMVLNEPLLYVELWNLAVKVSLSLCLLVPVWVGRSDQRHTM